MRLIAEKVHIFADSLTLSRFFISGAIIFTYDIFQASIFVVAGWATDMFDGLLARKYGGTHLGKLDLYADLTFASSILINLVNHDCVSTRLAVIFTLLFIGVYLIFKNEAPLMLWMALIYGRFLLSVWYRDKNAFAVLLTWIILIPILTPHRSLEQIKRFFSEIRKFT